MVQPVARTIVLHKGKVLLLRNKYKDGEFYGFPGGWQEEHESPEECAIRETKEETNLEVELIKPLYLHEFIKGKIHKETRYFLAEPLSDPRKISVHGDPDSQDNKPQEALWVPIGKLTSLPMRPAEFVTDLLEQYKEGFIHDVRQIPTTRE